MERLSPIIINNAKIATIASLNGLLFGLDTGIIATTQKILVHIYQFSEIQWSIIVSITILGAFLGASFSGQLCNGIGRKQTLLITAVGFVIGSFILTVETGFKSLFFGRLIIGICIGVASYAAPLFIAELSPANMRGRLVLFNCVFITLGETIAYFIGYILHNDTHLSCRLMFLTCLLPSILLLINIHYVPKSPRWLIKNNQLSQALVILKNLRTEANAYKEYRAIVDTVQSNQIKTKFSSLMQKKFMPILLIGAGLGIFQQFVGINTVMYYGPYIIHQAGFHDMNHAILLTFYLGLINTITTLIVILIIDRVGRRKLLLIGTFFASVSLLLVSSVFNNQSYSGYITFFGLSFYVFFYALSLGSLFWLIISEIYPTHIRALAMSIVSGIQWLANFVITFSFLPVVKYYGNIGNIFLFFSLMSMLAFLFSYHFIPETGNVSLERIESNLKAGMQLRYLGMKE